MLVLQQLVFELLCLQLTTSMSPELTAYFITRNNMFGTYLLIRCKVLQKQQDRPMENLDCPFIGIF
jgi:hypothetical protein